MEKKTEITQSIRWDEEGQPISQRFDDIYFSKHNGLEESRYVFIEQNQLTTRFQALSKDALFIIGETGFGSGLNFLSCWQHWLDNSPSEARLHFVSVEKYPLHPDDLQRALSLWPSLSELTEQFIAKYRVCYTGPRQGLFHYFCFDRVSLCLIIDDAAKGLQSLLNSPHPDFYKPQWQGIDAWLLDGFAPSKNPNMWSEPLFQQLATLSHQKSTLATFTAASQVRKGLNAVGFTVQKVAGYGQKREMLIGSFCASNPCPSKLCPPKTIDKTANKTSASLKACTPWMYKVKHETLNSTTDKQIPIAIIGGGLAGCHTAHLLAKRGHNVHLYDKHNNIAQGASGNPQGILYAKLSHRCESLGEFNLASLLYAQTFYQQFWQDNTKNKKYNGECCGVEQRKHQDFFAVSHAFKESEWLSISEGKQYLTFPYCGWLNPVALCKWLIQHENIQCFTQQNIQQLDYQDQKKQWFLNRDHQSHIQGYSAIIICNSFDAKQFSQTQWLPTKKIRGQVSYIHSQDLANLDTVVCADSYVAPAFIDPLTEKQQHCIGASFNLHHHTDELREEDHQENLSKLTEQLGPVDHQLLGGRVSFRCTSPDYLPLIGPVPQHDAFIRDYQDLSNNALKTIAVAGSYYPQLYLNIAHGSRGLAYTPLAALMIANQISGEPLPIPRRLNEALLPARFIMRDLKRNRLRQRVYTHRISSSE